MRGRDGRRRVSLRKPSSRKKLKLRRVPTIHLPLVARVNATLCTPYSSPNLMSAQRAPPEHEGLPFFFNDLQTTLAAEIKSSCPSVCTSDES